jgi:glutathione S-transferase
MMTPGLDEVVARHLKLYYFPVAPNPTRVRLYLAEKAEGGASIPLELVSVDVRKGEQNRPEHLARNPFGRLPVLEYDDGGYLTESLAIMEYLEERFPIPVMLGDSPEDRARVRELERIAELGVLYPIARGVHATNSPFGWPPVPEIVEFYRPRLDKALEVLNDRMADGRPFVAGDRPTIADCTLQAGLHFGRFGKLPLDPRYKQIAEWDRAYRERPGVREVLLF